MPKSFLLKRFGKTDEWNESSGLTGQGSNECLKADTENCIKQASNWDSKQEMYFALDMEWNRLQPQKHIATQCVYPDTTAKQVNHMNYNDSENLLIIDEKRSGDTTTKSSTSARSTSHINTVPSAGSDKKQTYKCGQCGKVFKTKYTLTIHLKMPSHTGARPFVCAICGKGFRLSSTLCRHKIIHTSNKPHRCQTCGKAFNRSSTLKTHQRTHSDTKEFSCHICDKGFHQKGNLRNHLLIHSGEKPYKCNLCKKAFNKLSNLKFHMHVHTDNKPYRCRFCKESFSRRCELKEHIVKCAQNIDNSTAAVVDDNVSYH